MNQIPLGAWEMDISWDWNITYPVMIYGCEVGQPTSTGACVCMTTHKKNKTIKIQTVDYAEDADSNVPAPFMGATVEITFGHIFQLGLSDNRSTFDNSAPPREHSGWDDVFKDIAELNVGPMPFIRRPGVALSIGDGWVGCLVPHKIGRHGCMCEYDRSYFCTHNPFYDITKDPTSNDGSDVVRINPLFALTDSRIIAPGTMLFLRSSSEVSCFPS